MPSLIIVGAAEDEIEQARAYLRRSSPVAAKTFLAKVRRVLGVMADAPEQWPEYKGPYRFFALRRHSYVIYCEILEADTVRVVAVAHSNQRPDYWMGR
jgi:plasmid stabilization system protein ParE